MNLDLNKVEAEALIALLDVAVKAGGLAVAHNALALAQKVQASREKESRENANILTLNLPPAAHGEPVS